MIVEHFGSSKLGQISPVITDILRNKPLSGGLWASPIESNYSWKNWCIEERFCTERLEQSFRLEISTDRLLKIDSYCDYTEYMVCKGFVKRCHQTALCVDFEAISLVYDGIWLTQKGEIETRSAYPHNLHGWDCETVLLFNHNPIIKEL